ncbi:MAG: ATP-binding protein [Bryobacteraceae bacterium]|jgi:signal transduction histidine kinase
MYWRGVLARQVEQVGKDTLARAEVTLQLTESLYKDSAGLVRTALLAAKETLERRVIERTSKLQERIEAKDRALAKLAAAQRRLIELSREAGIAEIATVGHIKQMVATRQNHAKVSGLVEDARLSELVDDALRILEPGLIRHGIKAIKRSNGKERVIRVCIRRRGEGRARPAIQDTGVGLPPENVTRIFGHSFTTKADGHGFGLHSCALAASQMGGSFWAESEGARHGATFVLEFPLKSGDDTTEKVYHVPCQPACSQS